MNLPRGTRLLRQAASGLAMLLFVALVIAGCKPQSEETSLQAPQGQASSSPSSPSSPQPSTQTPATGSPAATGSAAVAGTPAQPAADASLRPPKAGQPTPQVILEKMAAAYKTATSYGDQGTVRVQAALGDQKVDQSVDYSVAFLRPNKLRLKVFQGVVVSDAQQLWGFSQELPGQVLKRQAPQQLTFQDVLSDEVLANSLTQGPTQSFSWVPVQLLLLWADDPLKTILYQSQDPVLLGTGTVEDRECYRIDVTRPEGKNILWIDSEQFVLRRIELPGEELARALGGGQQLDSVSVVADFHGAQLNGQINAEAFQFETPPEQVTVVEHLAPPMIRMLGKPAPDFKFVDLEGNEVTPKSLEGKVAVLDFWATWCGPCRMTLPLVEKVYQQFKDHDKVVFLAVSVDEMSVSDQQLRDTFKELKVNMPIGRDPEQHVGRSFQTMSIPTMFLLGKDGLVQYAESGAPVNLEVVLADRLSELLAGRDISSQVLERFEAQRKQYREFIEDWLAKGLYVPPMNEAQEIPEAEIAQKSQPKAFTLTSLWKNTELKEPGNILVVPQTGGPPQILVLDGWKNVAEIGPDGKVVATHPLAIGDREAASFLRTAVDGSGRRYFAASGSMQQRVHLFDENWKPLASFPENALENPHTGIADVQLADVQGDGKLELCLGYWGVNGAQAASFDGKLLWSNKSIDTVLRVAVLGADDQGRHNVLCTNNRGSLVILGPDGKAQGEVQVPGQMFHWIVSADLDGQEPLELCGLSARDVGVSEAVGVNLQGEQLWNYPLPKGVHRRPVELIVPGRLKREGPGQWLLPAADGSIHAVAADGKPIDHFNYGVALDGLGTTEINGQPVLLVASSEGVEAFQVNWPGQ